MRRENVRRFGKNLMTIADVIQLPKCLMRAPAVKSGKVQQIEAEAFDPDSWEAKIEHVKQLGRIAQRAMERADEKRREALAATQEAAEYTKDYQEAQAELDAELRAEGAIP